MSLEGIVNILDGKEKEAAQQCLGGKLELVGGLLQFLERAELGAERQLQKGPGGRSLQWWGQSGGRDWQWQQQWASAVQRVQKS